MDEGTQSVDGLNSLENTFEKQLLDEIPKARSWKQVVRWTFLNLDNFTVVIHRAVEISDNKLLWLKDQDFCVS